jgi:hypothetical protein
MSRFEPSPYHCRKRPIKPCREHVAQPYSHHTTRSLEGMGPANALHATHPHYFLPPQTGVRTPDPSRRISFRVVLHRPEQLPNDLEHHLELPRDHFCMHLGRSAPERTQARAAGESAMVFAPSEASPHHALCSHRTRICPVLGMASVEGCQ